MCYGNEVRKSGRLLPDFARAKPGTLLVDNIAEGHLSDKEGEDVNLHGQTDLSSRFTAICALLAPKVTSF